MKAIIVSLAALSAAILAQDGQGQDKHQEKKLETVTSSAGLSFTVPEGWVVEKPKNAMRAAQIRLPKDEGDSEDGELVVFYFGKEGAGGVDANLQRWYGQFSQPDGRLSADVAEVETHKVGDLEIHTVDLTGTYVAETAPGSGKRVNKLGFRMLGAIVMSKSGPHFVKAVGPEATLERWKEDFDAFVDSARE